MNRWIGVITTSLAVTGFAAGCRADPPPKQAPDTATVAATLTPTNTLVASAAATAPAPLDTAVDARIAHATIIVTGMR
ncbi:hypothetical protein JYT28_00260 [Desulfobulbus sp. AH-315-M07]|nr:hypothetical protein [Desulfobulbus sp. AH-315-M07]